MSSSEKNYINPKKEALQPPKRSKNNFLKTEKKIGQKAYINLILQ